MASVARIIPVFKREAAVKKTMLIALAFGLTLVAGTAAAQPAPVNQAGVTMGHWHIASKDVEANKKLFVAMGGKLYMPGGQPLIMFPGLYISLVLGNEKGEGGSVGSVVNHVGFIVDNVQKRVAEWKAKGVNVLPGGALPNGGGNRLDQAYVETPDGVRMEILEDKTQTVPIRNEHIHFFVPKADLAKAVEWYAKTFGGQTATRNNAPVVNLPGVQLRFNAADTKQAPRRFSLAPAAHFPGYCTPRHSSDSISEPGGSSQSRRPIVLVSERRYQGCSALRHSPHSVPALA